MAQTILQAETMANLKAALEAVKKELQAQPNRSVCVSLKNQIIAFEQTIKPFGYFEVRKEQPAANTQPIEERQPNDLKEPEEENNSGVIAQEELLGEKPKRKKGPKA